LALFIFFIEKKTNQKILVYSNCSAGIDLCAWSMGIDFCHLGLWTHLLLVDGGRVEYLRLIEQGSTP